MKKLFGLITVLTVLMLQGCSSKTPGEFFADYSPPDRSNEINACRTWVQQKEVEERKQYDRLQSHDMSYALMHRETMSMVKEVFGKRQDVCSPGTNEMDAYIAYVKETEASNRVYAQEGGSTVRLGLGIGGAVLALDKIGDMSGDHVTGNQTVTGRDNVNAKTTEGNIELSGKNSETRSETSTSQVQTGASTSNLTNANAAPPPIEADTPVVAETPIL
jgi:hypothetical protein